MKMLAYRAGCQNMWPLHLCTWLNSNVSINPCFKCTNKMRENKTMPLFHMESLIHKSLLNKYNIPCMTCTADWVTLHNIKACPIFSAYQFLLCSEHAACVFCIDGF